MKRPTPSFNQIITEICTEENIYHQLLSLGWLHRLEKSGQTRYIFGHKFSVNSQAASLVADDKFATYEALRAAKLPTIDYAILYAPTNHATYALNCNSLDYAKDYLANHNSHIVAKPANGTCGRNVFFIQTPDQIAPAISEIFCHTDAAVLCPFYHIVNKFRFVILDQKVRLAFGRRPDGSYDNNLPAHPDYPYLRETALGAARALDLRFCSVDFIESDSREFSIIEVNSGIMTKHYLNHHPEQLSLVKNLYRDAIRAMFAPRIM